MASFDEALPKVLKFEGGYVNDYRDSGGETIMGIARRYHPRSPIWKIVDDYKTKYKGKDLNKALLSNETIVYHVSKIYKEQYWDRLKLDYVKSQAVAYQFFDVAVNMGVIRAIKLMQRIAGRPITGTLDAETIKFYSNYGK